MRFLLNTTSTHPDCNGNCDYGLIEMTPEYASLILRRHAAFLRLAREEDLLGEVTFWDASIEYFEHCDAFDALDEDREKVGKPSLFAGEDWVLLEDGVAVPEEAFQRTECDRLVVAVDRVRWCSIPRHCSFWVSTGSVPIAEIAKIASR